MTHRGSDQIRSKEPEKRGPGRERHDTTQMIYKSTPERSRASYDILGNARLRLIRWAFPLDEEEDEAQERGIESNQQGRDSSTKKEKASGKSKNLKVQIRGGTVKMVNRAFYTTT